MIFDLLLHMAVYCNKDAYKITVNKNPILDYKQGLKELRETDTLVVSGDMI